jgi:signal transduction histidine kinase
MQSLGQTPKMDSLKIIVKKWSVQPISVERDSLLTVTIYEICSVISLTEPDLRQTWTDSLSRFSKISRWEQSVAYSHFANGRNFHFKGFTTLAFKEMELAAKLFKQFQNEKMHLAAFSNISVMIANFSYGKPLADKTTEKKNFVFLSEGLELAKKHGNPLQIANMNLNLILHFLRHKNYEEAKKHSIYAFEITKRDTEKYFYQHFCGKWYEGICLAYLGKTKQGFEIMNQMKLLAQKPRKDGYDKYFLLNNGLSLGDYFLEKKEYQNAINEVKIAESALKSMKLSTFDYAVNKIFYEAYKHLNQSKDALAYYEKMQAYEEEEYHKEAMGQYFEFQLKYEDEKQKNQIKSLENQKLTQTRNVLSLAGLLALGIIGYVFWNNRKLKKKNEEIQSALLQGQTMERKRMASELHDNISNKILGVKMRIEMLENKHFTEKDKSNYEATLGFIDEVYSDIRLVSHNLLPEELETKGLGVAVGNLIKKINLIGKTHFENSFETLPARFSPRLEYEIYNIILELVNNILKHAEAKNALISIFQENNLLKISVKDNGKGFDSQIVNFDSLGIKSIRSRIEALRGKIEILNNNGTEVLIEIPV